MIQNPQNTGGDLALDFDDFPKDKAVPYDGPRPKSVKGDILRMVLRYLRKRNTYKERKFKIARSELQGRQMEELEQFGRKADMWGPDDFNSSPYTDKGIPNNVLESWALKLYGKKWLSVKDVKTEADLTKPLRMQPHTVS